jgi:TnpA family transposase
MVTYATALRLGAAETEAILRRSARTNLQHPTYRALTELGKAARTVFSAATSRRRCCAARIRNSRCSRCTCSSSAWSTSLP